ncbi:MAG TPA: hypothetical protein P5239_10505 [Victivallales bacterium]|nr:hypothetical protein [Victivallales bacterium]HRU02118.1 hypothetical protein [Victivallales bacterium]
MIKSTLQLLCLVLLFPCFSACTHHKVETESKVELAPVEVKPIHIVLDVNIKIQEELKKKFEKEDEIAKSISDEEAQEALRKYLEEKK